MSDDYELYIYQKERDERAGYKLRLGFFTAGSPIEPGDRVTVDAEGRCHAVPRRHDSNGWAGGCVACGARFDDVGLHGPCPGPKGGG